MKPICRLFIAALLFVAGCSSDSSTVAQYSNDSLLKSIGQREKAPFFVNPENPEAGDEVTIEVNIEGASTITFTVVGGVGIGCGTIASATGANPLTVTGIVGDRGYCDMMAQSDNGLVYEGRLEIEAENPDIPAIGLDSDIWEQDDMPTADADGPVIGSVTGPDSIEAGSTNTFTMNYTGGENVAGVFMQIVDHPHGYFFAPVSGSSGAAEFSIVVDSDYFADVGASGTATVDVTFVAVDELNRFSESYGKTLTITAAVADESVKADVLQSYTASGKVTYIKRIATRNGLEANGKYVPVRYATVKAISKEDGTTVLKESATAEDGTYNLSFTNSYEDKTYFVRVYTTSNALKQSVVNLSDEVFAVNSEDVDGAETPNKTALNIAITEANNAGAFNIWDVGTTANLYAKTSTGTAPPAIKFYWEKGKNKSTDASSYYESDAGLIALAGATSDPDEYDDIVIGHEYGHFTMDKYSTDDSQGGDHTPSRPADPRLALSEGWATFFAGAALGRSEYIDTNADPDNTTYYSFETPPPEFPKGSVGSAVTGNLSEVIPNAVLWDLYDENNETKDTLKNNGPAIWKVMTTYLKRGYAKFADRGVKGRDLVDVLDGWICLGFGNTGPTDSEGLRGASVGLMRLTSGYVKADLASCK